MVVTTMSHRFVVVSSLLLVFAGAWYTIVNRHVPEPYLDEVFHIRQAITFWKNKWGVWDPKITTPPGLYLVSYALLLPFKLVSGFELGPSALRLVNVVALAVYLPWILFRILEVKEAKNAKERATPERMLVVAHTVFNICLFPPLIFFSALYYTDVLSVCFVLHSYLLFLKANDVTIESRPARVSRAVRTGVATFLSGIWSLWFRQTNIFWVAVFQGGLEVVRLFDCYRECDGLVDAVKVSWHDQRVYDPDVSEAGVEDYCITAVSMIVASLSILSVVLLKMAPYVAILASFGGFVAWNGSVVLGDKEHHVASIHVPQVLYMWAYFMFFSFPLSAPYLVDAVVPPRLLPRCFRPAASISRRLPRVWVSIVVVGGMLVAIRYNTVVHPFTLADNRHYVFYVFRILLRKRMTKYAASVVYFVCAWAVTASLCGPGHEDNSPLGPGVSSIDSSTASVSAVALSSTDTRPSESKMSAEQDSQKRRCVGDSSSSTRVSFVMIWFVSTALALIPAPLVEPRYFLLPWIVWRLQVPARLGEVMASGAALTGSYDVRLCCETAWFVVVNCVTMYIFIAWGFAWPQEPGKVQRFLW